MKDIEDAIAEIAKRADEFTMTVSVDWIDYQHEDIVEQLVELAMEEADDEIARVLAQCGVTAGADQDEEVLRTKIEAGLRARLGQMRSQNTKRAQDVHYSCTFKMKDGEDRTETWSTSTADLWL